MSHKNCSRLKWKTKKIEELILFVDEKIEFSPPKKTFKINKKQRIIETWGNLQTSLRRLFRV